MLNDIRSPHHNDMAAVVLALIVPVVVAVIVTVDVALAAAVMPAVVFRIGEHGRCRAECGAGGQDADQCFRGVHGFLLLKCLCG